MCLSVVKSKGGSERERVCALLLEGVRKEWRDTAQALDLRRNLRSADSVIAFSLGLECAYACIPRQPPV